MTTATWERHSSYNDGPKSEWTSETDEHLPREAAQQRNRPEDYTQAYLREIGQVALLNSQEEVALATDIASGKQAQTLLARGNHEPSERASLERAATLGDSARQRLIQANLRLVVSIAKKYISGPLTFMDLVQEGNIGLMRAVEKFDAQLGHRFSTYATWWIRQSISRALSEQSRTIRLPVHLSESINKLRRTTRQLEQALGREPTTEEIGQALDMSEQRVTHLLRVSAQPLSLEQPLNVDTESTIGDVMVDNASQTPIEAALHLMLGEEIKRMLGFLSERERNVLQLRYGLKDGHRYTLEQVGAYFGITRERTRQIENEALRRLRALSLNAHLESYLDES